LFTPGSISLHAVTLTEPIFDVNPIPVTGKTAVPVAVTEPTEEVNSPAVVTGYTATGSTVPSEIVADCPVAVSLVDCSSEIVPNEAEFYSIKCVMNCVNIGDNL